MNESPTTLVAGEAPMLSGNRYLSTWTASSSGQAARESRSEWFASNYARWLPESRQSAILEIGPGYGEFLDFLRNVGQYSRVTAIDTSLDVVEHCNHLFPGAVSHCTDSRLYFEAHPACYDLIVMFHVLEHVPKAAVVPLLTSIRTALRPSGRLLIEVPNMANPVIGLYKRYADFTHECGYTQDSLAQVLRLAEFVNAQILEVKVPTKSVRRKIQAVWQRVVSQAVQAAAYPYVPGKKLLLSPAIAAVARP